MISLLNTRMCWEPSPTLAMGRRPWSWGPSPRRPHPHRRRKWRISLHLIISFHLWWVFWGWLWPCSTGKVEGRKDPEKWFEEAKATLRSGGWAVTFQKQGTDGPRTCWIPPRPSPPSLLLLSFSNFFYLEKTIKYHAIVRNKTDRPHIHFFPLSPLEYLA